MKRWKQSGVVRFFLLIVLSVSVLMDVLAGMYLFVGKEYALSGKRGGNDFLYHRKEPLAFWMGISVFWKNT